MHKPVSVSLVLLALSAAVQPAAAQNLSPMAPPQTAYVTVAQVDVMKLVPPPPAPQSEEQQRDIEKLLAIQKTRTPQQERRALADATSGTFGFADVLGPKFTATAAPKLALLMDKIRGDGAAVENAGKDNWKRPRPFETSKDVRPVGDLPKSSSYPRALRPPAT
jgi:acid phosphatase (class A)